MNPDCYFGDHTWRGGVCVGCDARLRCYCGVFARTEQDWWDKHYKTCPVIRAIEQQDVRDFERSLP